MRAQRVAVCQGGCATGWCDGLGHASAASLVHLTKTGRLKSGSPSHHSEQGLGEDLSPAASPYMVYVCDGRRLNGAGGAMGWCCGLRHAPAGWLFHLAKTGRLKSGSPSHQTLAPGLPQGKQRPPDRPLCVPWAFRKGKRPLGSPWASHGRPHERPLGVPWIRKRPHGRPAWAPPWASPGRPLGVPWASPGIKSVPHGRPLGVPWASPGRPLGLP